MHIKHEGADVSAAVACIKMQLDWCVRSLDWNRVREHKTQCRQYKARPSGPFVISAVC